jgi:hypothetical protein
MQKYEPEQILLDACRNGNLQLAKEITKTECLTIRHARFQNNAALRYACKYGHTSTAQWLVKTFQLTAEDIKIQDHYALWWTCLNSDFVTAQWLLNTYYTVDDAIKMSNCTFITRDMKEWLEDYQPIGTFTKPVKM